MQYDPAGNVQNIIINDTGMGTCQQSVPWTSATGPSMSAAMNATGGTNNHIVTNNPVW